jgi:hypothetical protein
MRVGEGRRVGEMHVGEGRMSARPSSPATGDGDAHVLGRGITSGRSGASKKGGALWMGVARTGGGDDDGGREATATTIWEEKAK